MAAPADNIRFDSWGRIGTLIASLVDESSVWRALDDVHQTYLERLLLDDAHPLENMEYDRAGLLETALAIESLATGELRLKGQECEAERALSLAAELFEYLGDLEQRHTDRVREMSPYVHASICYSLAHYEASSAVIAGRIWNKFSLLDAVTDVPPIDRMNLSLERAVLALLRRDIGTAREAAIAALAGIRERPQTFQKHDSLRDLAGRAEVLRFVQATSDFLLTGDRGRRAVAADHIRRARTLLSEGETAFLYWLASRLELIGAAMEKRSIWTVLPSILERRPRYLEALARHSPPILELWTSQIRALLGGDDVEGVLGSSRGAVVVMPTSTGKTRVAEIAIADALDPDGTETAVYIAPTRALVAQVESKLSRTLGRAGYPVATSTGSYEVIPGLEDILLSDTRVLVTTPEKLDLLARRGDPLLTNARLFIIDEGDMVDEGERGLRLEFLVRRLRRGYGPLGARFMLLSAVLPSSNYEQFARWLDGDVSAVHWRPTRLLEGVFNWRRGGTYAKGKRQYRHLEGDVHYLGRFPVRGILSGTEKLGTKVPMPERADAVAQLATLYAASLPPVLIFCLTKAMAEAAVTQVLANIRKLPGKAEAWLGEFTDVQQDRLEELAQLITDRFGPEAELLKAVRLGVAYHHASLPDDVRSAIERAMDQGDLRVLAATSTLAEGIDMPVRVVIFGATLLRMRNARTGADIELRLTARDFRNIAGRAGRALRETEGHAILVDPLSSERKLLAPDAIEESPVLSSCFQLAEWLGLEARTHGAKPETWLDDESEDIEIGGEPSGELRLLQRAFESAVFAEVNGGGVPDQLLEGSLYAHQVNVDDKRQVSEMAGLAAFSRHEARNIAKQHIDPQVARIFDQSGFSRKSCELLLTRVLRIVDESDSHRWTKARKGSQLLLDEFSDVLALAFLPDEAQPRQLDDAAPTDPEQALRVIYDWVHGASVPLLLSKHFNVGSSAKRRKAVTFLYGEVSQLIPWALSTVIRLLALRLDQLGQSLAPELLLIPGYIKQGVDHPVALLVTTLGQLDRQTARDIVAPHYPGGLPFDSGIGHADWQAFWEECRGWFASLEDFEVNSWAGQSPRSAAAIRDAVDRSRTRLKGWKLFLRCDLAGLEYAQSDPSIFGLASGDRVLLQREPNNAADPNAVRVRHVGGQPLGYVPRRFSHWVSGMLDQGVELRSEVISILGPESPPAGRVQLGLRREF